MKFSSSFKLPGSRQAISAMLRNPQYYRRRWEKLDPRPNVDLNDQDSTLTVTSTLAFTADTVRKLASFLDSEMTVKVIEIWNFNETGLVQGGTLSASVAGVPVKASFRINISPNLDAAVTTLQLQGEVTCAVPLVGAGIEKAIVQRLDETMRWHAEVCREFLQ